jgi:hypothetical protein
MATTYKILGQSKPSATTTTNLYIVPSETNTVISTITVCNLDSSAATYRISCVPSGDTLSDENYIVFGANVPANDTIALTLGLTLNSSGSVNVYASTASIAFGAFGSEIV